MTRIVSFINLKGGVAKTTTLVQLAETLAFIRGKRVLVIDLDPQTNATIALMGEEHWEQVDAQEQTVAGLFLDRIHGTDRFDLNRALVRGVSNLNRIKIPDDVELGPQVQYPRIDLLPGSIRLIAAQDRMADIPQRSFHTMSPMEVVGRAFGERFSHYDYVLIDCPPNLGYITQNGLEVSDFYLVPTIADRLSTYGIPQIVKTIATFKQARRLKLRCLGVLVTKYQVSSSLQRRSLATLPELLETAFRDAQDDPATLFDIRMPQSNVIAEAMDFENSPRNFRQKYGTQKSGELPMYEYPVLLAEEFIARLEGRGEAGQEPSTTPAATPADSHPTQA